MNYDQEARYQNLLLEQAMAKQKLKNFAESLSALDNQVIMEGTSPKTNYENAKKILDKMMDKFKIRKTAYTGEEDKTDYLKKGNGTCYIYKIPSNDFTNTVAVAVVFALTGVGFMTAGIPHNFGMLGNKKEYDMKDAVQMYNKAHPDSPFALQTHCVSGYHLVGFRDKSRTSNSIGARFGRWVTKNESVDPFEAIERARQIRALQEADAEAIKKAGINFSGLIKKMVDKFIAFSQQQITKTKPYLTNMKQQILAKLQGEDVPIEMRDYTTGVNRIKNFKLPPLESIKGKFKDTTNPDTVEQQMRHELLPEYKDDSIDFGTYTQAYFLGGEKKLNTNINALDMQAIFDYCDRYEAIYKEIEADGRSLERLSQDTAKAANDAQAVENQAKADANAQGKTAQNNPSAQNASAELWTMGQNIIESINMIINEEETNQTGTAKPNPQGGTTGQTGSTTPSGNGTKPDDGKMVIKPNESNPADANKNAVNANNANPKQEVNGEVNLINAYKKVGQRLLAAEMKAAGTIYKDYITIMKVHAPENGNNPVQQAAKDQEKKEQENNQNTQQAQPQK